MEKLSRFGDKMGSLLNQSQRRRVEDKLLVIISAWKYERFEVRKVELMGEHFGLEL